MTRLLFQRWAGQRWGEFIGAVTLLTRLPAGTLATAIPSPDRCVWAYPLVGALIGLAGAIVMAGALATGLPQPVAAIWALAATVLITGGLHEDGLADTADGFGGGRTAERKLAIMRDSRIGSFGALALVFGLVLRALALAVAPHPVQALVLAGALGRGAMVLPLLLQRPARPDGLAHALHTGRRSTALAALVLAALPALWSPLAGCAALAAGLVIAALSARQIGGYTGDTLGAAEQLAECAALSAVCT